MQTSRHGPVGGLAALCALLVALHATVGLSALAWAVGLGCGLAVGTAVAGGLTRFERPALGPADVVTFTRAMLACGVAALVADSFLRPPHVGTLVALAAVGLALDAVDGRVARYTGTISPFGARFDGEVDAFLIVVLSVYVASSFGWWVLAMGAARYAFGMAGWWLPWMGARLPFRFWRKVVTAAVGILLLVAAADVLPRPLTSLGLFLAGALLAETFGRDVWWLWVRRAVPAVEPLPVTAVRGDGVSPARPAAARP